MKKLLSLSIGYKDKMFVKPLSMLSMTKQKQKISKLKSHKIEIYTLYLLLIDSFFCDILYIERNYIFRFYDF